MTADTAGKNRGKPGRGSGVLRRIGYLIIGTVLILWATARELTNMGPGDGRIVPAPQGGTPTRVQATGSRWAGSTVTWTDANGRFILEAAEFNAPYKLVIERTGCESHEANSIVFEPGKTAEIRLPACR